MTKEEILAMEAGRELDAIIAESIFGLAGLKVFPDNDFWREGEKPPFIIHRTKSELKEYSTDISAAWQVVEKMEDDWALIISPAKFPDAWRYMVGFKDKHSGRYTNVKANSLKEIISAICKAALLAEAEGDTK